MPKSENEIVQLGNYVEQLFQQDHFNTLFEEFQQQSIKHMLATAPHETKTRETIYSQITGGRAFLDLMKQYVDMRDRIDARQELEADHPHDADVED